MGKLHDEPIVTALDWIGTVVSWTTAAAMVIAGVVFLHGDIKT